MFIHCLGFAEEITGHYCYTYGDKESMQEARTLVRTLAIRNAVESYKIFVESTTSVTDSVLSSDIIQALSNGYVKDIKVIKHTEEGRTVCDTIAGKIEPAQFEKALKSKIVSKKKLIEDTGIDNNGVLKILGSYVQVSANGSDVVAVVKSSVDINYFGQGNTSNLNTVAIDYFDKDGNPIGGNNRLVKDVIIGQISTVHFNVPFGMSTYRLWLPEKEKKPNAKRKNYNK